eukprot:COSAG01_NODE_17381_length_1155_cov_0.887417_1_plen_366_part_01
MRETACIAVSKKDTAVQLYVGTIDDSQFFSLDQNSQRANGRWPLAVGGWQRCAAPIRMGFRKKKKGGDEAPPPEAPPDDDDDDYDPPPPPPPPEDEDEPAPLPPARPEGGGGSSLAEIRALGRQNIEASQVGGAPWGAAEAAVRVDEGGLGRTHQHDEMWGASELGEPPPTPADEPEPEPPPTASLGRDARASDGCVTMWLQMKSGGLRKTWQRFWFVFTPLGELKWYKTPVMERQGKQQDMLLLERCSRITSNNPNSGHFELLMDGGKQIQLRVEDKSRETLDTIIRPLFVQLQQMSRLAPSNDGAMHVEALSSNAQAAALTEADISFGEPPGGDASGRYYDHAAPDWTAAALPEGWSTGVSRAT